MFFTYLSSLLNTLGVVVALEPCNTPQHRAMEAFASPYLPQVGLPFMTDSGGTRQQDGASVLTYPPPPELMFTCYPTKPGYLVLYTVTEQSSQYEQRGSGNSAAIKLNAGPCGNFFGLFRCRKWQ